ncbi:MAG: HD domain-containing protein [Hominenteromicrobium sp.]
MVPDESRLLFDALTYENGHLRRTQHILNVYALAGLLGEREALPEHDRRILRAAAILHDIAIKRCKEKYGDGCPENQRREAPRMVRDFLIPCGYPEMDIPRITELVVLHHCYDRISGSDFQLLVEADLIAGCFEAENSAARAEAVRPLFQSRTGLALLAAWLS